MNKSRLEVENARLRAENADLKRRMKQMDKLSIEQFKRLQESERIAQVYFNELMGIVCDSTTN